MSVWGGEGMVIEHPSAVMKDLTGGWHRYAVLKKTEGGKKIPRFILGKEEEGLFKKIRK